jgi:hypothetical protein
MARVHIQESREIAARPEAIWGVLTDYRHDHPRILPAAFGPLEVEQGGQGAGTVLHVDMHVLGATRLLHQVVSTPEPGRMLVESDVEGPNRTTFTLTPLEDGARTRVEFASDLVTSPGLFGAIEAAMTHWLISPIYREELGNLAALAAARDRSVPADAR